MKTYKEMTFDELLAYKERLITDNIWSGMSSEEKMEINLELEWKANKGNKKEDIKQHNL